MAGPPRIAQEGPSVLCCSPNPPPPPPQDTPPARRPRANRRRSTANRWQLPIKVLFIPPLFCRRRFIGFDTLYRIEKDVPGGGEN